VSRRAPAPVRGLTQSSAIHRAQIATIHKDDLRSRLRPPHGESAVRPIGHLSPQKMLEVDAALRYNLGL
jgi:mRNA-degrading endonuclease toxin of MazEF toxin-antitoxin module